MQKLLQNWFNISADTSATIIISLTVFLLGFLISGIISVFTRMYKRRNVRIVFRDAHQSLITSLNKRIDGLHAQRQVINDDGREYFLAVRTQFYQVEILQELGYEKIFHAFTDGFENVITNRKKKIRALRRSWENLALLGFWEPKLFDEVEPAQQTFNTYNERMGVALREVRIRSNFMFDALHEPAIAPRYKEYLEKLKIVIQTWESLPDNRRLKNLFEFYIKPIRELSHAYAGSLHARELRDVAMDAYRDYEHLRDHMQLLDRGYYNYSHILVYFRRSTKIILKIMK